MKMLVAGGAGFIGSNLVVRLLKDGHRVVVLDNLVAGREEFLPMNSNLIFHKGDLRDGSFVMSHMRDIDMVWHLAANPDVRNYKTKDLLGDINITTNILDAMKDNNIKKIAYSSSSTVYGNAPTPTQENCQLNPISIYGASKVSCESIIAAFSSSFGITANIFRFANIIGRNQTHGIIVDFIKKLRNDSNSLEILGDGKQQKSFMLVDDCVDAMIHISNKMSDNINTFNLGTSDSIDVISISKCISSAMNLNPDHRFTGGSGGWVGDVPKMLLSIEKLRKTGWNCGHNSKESIEMATKQLLKDFG